MTISFVVCVNVSRTEQNDEATRTITNIETSIADSKPKIGDIRIVDKDAPTVPLPLTIASSINLASGNRCDNIPNPNIRIRIIE